jgi:ribosomal-protein-alanine N-acetyltransferase
VASDWLIRRASSADLHAILALEQACAEAPHWTRTAWQSTLSHNHETAYPHTVFVAEHQDGVCGFAAATCADELAELESVAVSEPARRQGIGRAVCRHVIDWSREMGARTIQLEVRASSQGALTLYRSLGFVEQGRRRQYYQNPAEDAVLMAAPL